MFEVSALNRPQAALVYVVCPEGSAKPRVAEQQLIKYTAHSDYQRATAPPLTRGFPSILLANDLWTKPTMPRSRGNTSIKPS